MRFLMLSATIGISTLLAILLVLALASYWFYSTNFGVTGFHVSGTVKNGATGDPVPHARVIVVITPMGVEAPSRCYGLVADHNGAFDVVYDAGIRMKHRLSVLASAPDDSYAEMGTHSPPVANQRLLATNLLLETKPLPERRASKSHYRYATFCAGGIGTHSLHFVGSGWQPRYNETVAEHEAVP